jgi:hypothetical protein
MTRTHLPRITTGSYSSYINKCCLLAMRFRCNRGWGIIGQLDNFARFALCSYRWTDEHHEYSRGDTSTYFLLWIPGSKGGAKRWVTENLPINWSILPQEGNTTQHKFQLVGLRGALGRFFCRKGWGWKELSWSCLAHFMIMDLEVGLPGYLVFHIPLRRWRGWMGWHLDVDGRHMCLFVSADTSKTP